MKVAEQVKVSSEIQSPMRRPGKSEGGTSNWWVPLPNLVLMQAFIDIRMLKS
jgi:hypothetical protein